MLISHCVCTAILASPAEELTFANILATVRPLSMLANTVVSYFSHYFHRIYMYSCWVTHSYALVHTLPSFVLGPAHHCQWQIQEGRGGVVTKETSRIACKIGILGYFTGFLGYNPSGSATNHITYSLHNAHTHLQYIYTHQLCMWQARKLPNNDGTHTHCHMHMHSIPLS